MAAAAERRRGQRCHLAAGAGGDGDSDLGGLAGVGDDYFVTNTKYLEQAIEKHSGNAMENLLFPFFDKKN